MASSPIPCPVAVTDDNDDNRFAGIADAIGRDLKTVAHMSAEQVRNRGSEQDSLLWAESSQIVRFNSLLGPKKFPVKMRRELVRKSLT